jgi:hypothetical protein
MDCNLISVGNPAYLEVTVRPFKAERAKEQRWKVSHSSSDDTLRINPAVGTEYLSAPDLIKTVGGRFICRAPSPSLNPRHRMIAAIKNADATFRLQLVFNGMGICAQPPAPGEETGIVTRVTPSPKDPLQRWEFLKLPEE